MVNGCIIKGEQSKYTYTVQIPVTPHLL